MVSGLAKAVASGLVLVGAGVVATTQGPIAPGLRALDVVVALALGGAAILAPAPRPARALLGAASLTWSAASRLPIVPWHQGLLLAALLLLVPPPSRPGAVRIVALGAALAVFTGWGGQGAAAVAGLAATAAILVEDLSTRAAPPRTWYAAVATASLGLVWGSAWIGQRWWPERFDPRVAFAVYSVVVIGLAAGFVLVAREDRRRSWSRLGRALEAYVPGAPAPVRLLEAALGEALADDRLRLVVGEAGMLERGPRDVALVLTDPGTGRARAAVASQSRALRDDEVRRRLLHLLDLVATEGELVARREDRVRELAAARDRVLAVVDDERGRALRLLGADVVPRVRSALSRLDRLGENVPGLGIVREDLRQVEAVLDRLVVGQPPAGLGEGTLPAVLADVMARAPVPGALQVRGRPCGSARAETALYFACLEALANVARHAGASRVVVALAAEGEDLVLSVEDDGCGGADPSGQGLQGLADRMSASGGRLLVGDRAEGGTRLVARVSRSAARGLRPD